MLAWLPFDVYGVSTLHSLGTSQTHLVTQEKHDQDKVRYESPISPQVPPNTLESLAYPQRTSFWKLEQIGVHRSIDAVNREELARGPLRAVKPIPQEDADGVFE